MKHFEIRTRGTTWEKNATFKDESFDERKPVFLGAGGELLPAREEARRALELVKAIEREPQQTPENLNIAVGLQKRISAINGLPQGSVITGDKPKRNEP